MNSSFKIRNSTKFYLFISFWPNVNNISFILGNFSDNGEGAALVGGQDLKIFNLW